MELNVGENVYYKIVNCWHPSCSIGILQNSIQKFPFNACQSPKKSFYRRRNLNGYPAEHTLLGFGQSGRPQWFWTGNFGWTKVVFVKSEFP